MWTIVSSLLENSSFRKILIGVAFVATLIIGGIVLYNHVYDQGKQDGIVYQTQIFNKQQDAAKALLDQEQKTADAERATLNNTISSLTNKTAQLQSALDKKSNLQSQKVIEYAKTDNGSKSCFDSTDSGLRIINESFPDSN